MVSSGVCAVMVTFLPSEEFVENIVRIRDQVQDVVVVDNGSPEKTRVLLRNISKDLGVIFIQNEENAGIAAALNRGIRRAESLGYDKVILLDQDSAVTENFVSNLLRTYEENPQRDVLAIVVPSYVDRRSGEALPAEYAKGRTLELAMSSGSLMPISVFHQQGWFEEGLFIDYVDYEYCLRVRSAGYLIEECRSAILMHAPGDPQVCYLFGLVPIRSANYSAFRRYFLERNMIWMVRKYGRTYPALCFRMFLNSVKDCIKILLVEKGKGKKLSSSLRGLADGIRMPMEMNVRS